MKVGIVISGNIWASPYINYYINVLVSQGVDYDIISWNRDGSDPMSDYSFKKRIPLYTNRTKKLFSFLRYTTFVKKVILKNKYDKLIVFGSQVAIILYPFLKRKYDNKFVLDYRDQSIEQKFKKTYSRVLAISSLNVISSPGFTHQLPKSFEYILCHNFDIKDIDINMTNNFKVDEHKKIKILTIGAIRDYSSNIEIVEALKGNNDVLHSFVGKSEISNAISAYVKANNITNVDFKGYYKKNEESLEVQKSTFISIYHSTNKCCSSNELLLLSNRFYLSLLYRRPMIVASGTVQANYLKEYNVGIVTDTCSGLYNNLKDWLANLDYEDYNQSCESLINRFMSEQKLFEKHVRQFITSK